ncbi:thymidylate synthase [Streptomyces sp. NPDC059916]|uniref:thymidylate synthase n=1 Tax=Streptomyces sp. NPDC059916 TaxID=3347001 RepID=UPI0036847629
MLELLRTESDSKRGYLPVFSAAELAVADNPDMACLAGLHLFVRNGRLHMVCHMRANDLDCGLLSDVFSFTMIQEYAAIQLGLELGHYTHTIGSAHVNECNVEGLDEAPRYYLQHGFGYQCHDRAKPHHHRQHGRADIGWTAKNGPTTP